MISVALDPGKWKMGLAVTNDGVLVQAKAVWVFHRSTWDETAAVNAVLRMAPAYATRWDIERPQVYHGNAKSSVQEDVALLSKLVDRLVRELKPLGAEIHVHAPYAWKRSVPKEIHRRRLRAVLSPVERSLVEPSGTNPHGKALPDVWDAVGLALFGAGRVGVGGSRLTAG